MPPKDENGWNEYAKLVLSELERLDKWCGQIATEQQNIRIEIAKLKVKSGVWGAVAGAIPVVIGLAIWLIKVNMK